MNRSMINYIAIAGGGLGAISLFLPWAWLVGSLFSWVLPIAIFLLFVYGGAIGYSIYNIFRSDEPSRVGPILLTGLGGVALILPLGLSFVGSLVSMKVGFYVAFLAAGLILTSGVMGIIATRNMPFLPQRYFGQSSQSQNQSQAYQPWAQSQQSQQPWGQPQPPQQPQPWGQPQPPQQPWQPPQQPQQPWGQPQPPQQPQQPWQPPQQPQQPWQQPQQPQQNGQGPVQGWHNINHP